VLEGTMPRSVLGVRPDWARQGGQPSRFLIPSSTLAIFPRGSASRWILRSFWKLLEEIIVRPKRRIAYLSGAPRVSTDPHSPAAGPRAHVLGVIDAFRILGVQVTPYIVGDRVSRLVRDQGRRMGLRGGVFRQLAADLIRFLIRPVLGRRAVREVGTEHDLVYERFASMQALGRSFQRAGVPWILETQGPFYYEAKVERRSMVLTGLAKRLEIRAYRQCDLLVCVSEPLKRILSEAAGLDDSKIVVVPNGVDTTRFDPDRVEARRLAPGHVVGYVGSVRAWQGIDLLVAAIARLRADGLDISAVIVGDGPDRGGMQEAAMRLGIESYVHFTGHAAWDEIPSFLKGFDIGFSGHRRMRIGHMYHSPLKLYEYAAMGLPIVASRFDDAEALLSAGVPGALFDPDDLDSLVAGLRDVLRTIASGSEYGTKAREAVIEHHSWTNRVGRIIGVAEERGWMARQPQ
jgi:glycosyltransferase involved in cell wall biosynthesis